MAFVVTLLLLMFGAFVVMLFQTRMQQQEMAEQLSRLQKEVEQLRRRQPLREQRLAESESSELRQSDQAVPQHLGQAGLQPNAPSAPQPDFSGWPYNPNVPTSAASGASQPSVAAFDAIPSAAASPAQSAHLAAHYQPAETAVHPLPVQSGQPSQSTFEQPAAPAFSGSLTAAASAAGEKVPPAPAAQPAPAARQPEAAVEEHGVMPGSRPGTVRIRKRGSAQTAAQTPARTPAQAAMAAQSQAQTTAQSPADQSAQRRRVARPAEREESAFAPLIDWLMHGNLLLKTGVVVLFLGLVFLLRFASERIHVPIEMRYLSVMGSGLAAAVSGWFLQRRRREYGLILQGFGMAVMYLTTLAAVKLHPLLPAGTAFVLMVGLVCAMAALAVRQDAKIMAQVALIGGLAAPILVSDGSGSHVVLFTYLALLNTGVAAIARFKTWRSLNLIGFIGSLFIAVMWGSAEYTGEYFASTEPFLIFHWLLYTLLACLYALHRRDEADEAAVPDNAGLDELIDSLVRHGMTIGAIDGTLLFGSAVSAFVLQYHMLPEGGHWSAGAALGFAAVYALLAGVFTGSRDFPLLRQALAALSLVFATLAVPLAFEQAATVSLWSLEAGLVYVFALRQQRPHTRFLAVVVYALSLGALLFGGELGWQVVSEENVPLLVGPLVPTLATASTGLAMYAAWLRWRCRGSAYWESCAQRGALGAGLLLAGLLPLMCLPRHWAMVALAALAWAAVRVQAVLQDAFAPNPLAALSGSLSDEGGADEDADEADEFAWLPGSGLFAVAAVSWGMLAMLLLAVVSGGEGWLSTICCFAATLLLGASAYALHRQGEAWLPENEPGALLRGKHRRSRQQHDTAFPLPLLLHQAAGWLLLGLAFLGTILSSVNLLHHLPESLAGSAPLWTLPLPFALWTAAAWLLDWRQGRRTALLLVPLLIPNAMLLFGGLSRADLVAHALSGSLMHLALAALLAWVLRLQGFRSHDTERGWSMAAFALWAASATAFCGILAGEILGGVWGQIGWLALPLALWLLLYLGRERAALRPYAAACSLLCGGYALMWLVANNALEPRTVQPFTYLPLLNPMDLAGLLVGALWLRCVDLWQEEFELESEGLRLHLAGSVLLGLTLVSGAVLRLWYFYMGVEWTLHGIMASFSLQAALSIVWASAAIGLMVSGHRLGRRIRWMAGAGLMGVVVLKLFTVELGGSGGIARIVSFIGVGLLLLLVGWFAPVPPKEGED
ncbi:MULTISPECIES: DUF2339 domain-containing protein [unclassified Eikenella]|uniref:DUF2339 domain-containing protein n=1 Tax=unclassified Eikenella TaxID=2639367 RepID=UPI0008A33FFC|nr:MULTISPECIES: DUF2339 domain-containing protein [unclassified Eikenella]OFK85966.1 hypothetical protein HMPREF2796_06850 [Eikenella sp. HMSC071B05]OFO43772.1 hypothetical protein HMPREF3043_06530 [Eikenella sp. HMSC073A11]